MQRLSWLNAQNDRQRQYDKYNFNMLVNTNLY